MKKPSSAVVVIVFSDKVEGTIDDVVSQTSVFKGTVVVSVVVSVGAVVVIKTEFVV